VTGESVLDDASFCHLVVGVTEMDRALEFYRDVLGLEVVFETLISGEPFDAALHATRKQEGRVVGGLLGGLMVELLSIGANPPDQKRRGVTPDQETFEIGGVRMFFVKDPDGTPVEFIELPHGACSTYEMHRGVRLAMGPAA
jgi:catechol 2,3-dioxygenase-like lactoylglutathione lyase family enzyme